MPLSIVPVECESDEKTILRLLRCFLACQGLKRSSGVNSTATQPLILHQIQPSPALILHQIRPSPRAHLCDATSAPAPILKQNLQHRKNAHSQHQRNLRDQRRPQKQRSVGAQHLLRLQLQERNLRAPRLPQNPRSVCAPRLPQNP